MVRPVLPAAFPGPDGDPQFCTTVENVQHVPFIGSAPNITIIITPMDCQNGDGVAAGLILKTKPLPPKTKREQRHVFDKSYREPHYRFKNNRFPAEHVWNFISGLWPGKFISCSLKFFAAMPASTSKSCALSIRH